MEALVGLIYDPNGIKRTISGNKSITISSPATGLYWVYITGTDGTLLVTDEDGQIGGVDIDIASVVLVAGVIYNGSCTPKAWLVDERHTIGMPAVTHKHLHLNFGAFSQGGACTSSGSLPTAGDTDTEHQLAVAASTHYDEDIILSQDAFAGATGGDYTVFHRQGSGCVGVAGCIYLPISLYSRRIYSL
jgi:hypothetical protein